LSHKLNGSSWRSESLKRSYFDEETYDDKKLSPKTVKFHHEPENGDYDELCRRLSGEVVLSRKLK